VLHTRDEAYGLVSIIVMKSAIVIQGATHSLLKSWRVIDQPAAVCYRLPTSKVSLQFTGTSIGTILLKNHFVRDIQKKSENYSIFHSLGVYSEDHAARKCRNILESRVRKIVKQYILRFSEPSQKFLNWHCSNFYMNVQGGISARKISVKVTDASRAGQSVVTKKPVSNSIVGALRH